MSIDIIEPMLKDNSFIKAITYFNSTKETEVIEQDISIRHIMDCYKVDSCGKITSKTFSCNKFSMYENENFNSCLNGKISIDSDGNYHSCPSIKDTLGNIDNTTLPDVLETPEIKNLWHMNKTKIKTCSVCEYRMVCSDCRANTVNGEIDEKPLGCSYDPFAGKWLAAALMFFCFTSCAPQVSFFNSQSNNQNYTTLLNEEIGVIKMFSADYRMYDNSKVDYSLLPIKKGNIKRIYVAAKTVVPEYYGYILFTSKKVNFPYLTYLDIADYNYPESKFYIVEEKTLSNGEVLFALHYCMDKCVEDEFTSLKREVYSHHDLVNKGCKDYNDFIPTPSKETTLFSQLGYFTSISSLNDSLKFCETFGSQVLSSIAQSYNGLVQDIPPLNVDLDWKNLLDDLREYDIVLVKDDHVQFWEDILFNALIKKEPSLFNALLMETLNPQDSINERKHLLLSSGFYFNGYWQKELVTSSINANLLLLPYDNVEEDCGIDVACNQRREHKQSINIFKSADAYRRVLVFSGGSHSDLSCPEEYQYTGCILCAETEQKKIARIIVTNSSIIIQGCSGERKEYPVQFGQKRTTPNYNVSLDRPTFVALYNQEEFDNYSFDDMPEYLLFVKDNKEVNIEVRSGKYYEVEYNLLGTIRRTKTVNIK